MLQQQCQGRLTDIRWFRTDWQRGGALTGYATYTNEQQQALPVVIKLPVPPGERTWLVRLQHSDVVPRVYAHGEALGGYDMAWVVMERLPYGPLGAAWDGHEFDLIVQAAGRFYEAASQTPLQPPAVTRDYDAILRQARQNIRQQPVACLQRWNQTLKQVGRKLDRWLQLWEQRPIDTWCHGDLHFGNAMTRTAPPIGPAVLIDLALTGPGSWVEDAIYLEHLFWAHPQRLGGRKLVGMIAQQRKNRGLTVDADWPRLAEIRRALVAVGLPARLRHDGDPQNLQAALGVLEACV